MMWTCRVNRLLYGIELNLKVIDEKVFVRALGLQALSFVSSVFFKNYYYFTLFQGCELWRSLSTSMPETGAPSALWLAELVVSLTPLWWPHHWNHTVTELINSKALKHQFHQVWKISRENKQVGGSPSQCTTAELNTQHTARFFSYLV